MLQARADDARKSSINREYVSLLCQGHQDLTFKFEFIHEKKSDYLYGETTSTERFNSMSKRVVLICTKKIMHNRLDTTRHSCEAANIESFKYTRFM